MVFNSNYRQNKVNYTSYPIKKMNINYERYLTPTVLNVNYRWHSTPSADGM